MDRLEKTLLGIKAVKRVASVAILSGTVILVGCATPQERCVNSATKELSTVSNLAAETQANITRGYALDVSYVPYTVYETCYYGYRRAYSCPQTYTRTVRTPRSIEVAVEKRKLAELTKKAESLQEQTSAWVASCQLQYPE